VPDFLLRSRRPQRKINGLIRPENIIPKQISPEPDHRDDEERNKAVIVTLMDSGLLRCVGKQLRVKEKDIGHEHSKGRV
jgi:hypothetical protein